jgi:hypothetical protein
MRSLVALSLLFALGCARTPTECIAPEPVASSAPAIAAPELQLPRSVAAPFDVCRHVRAVSGDQTPPDQLVAAERSCVAALESVQQQYDAVTRCLLDASVVADVLACEQAMRSGMDRLGSLGPVTSELAICIHVMDVMKREFSASSAPSDEELAKFTQECVKDLAKEREKVGAEKFQAQVTCVMAAQNLEAMTKCDKD